MLPSAMVVEIQAHGFDDILDTRIYPLLTAENRRLCSKGPFPFLEKFSAWNETLATPNSPLSGAPADIRAVLNFGQPAVANSAGNITYLRRSLIEKFYGTNSYLLQDFPRHYNLYGKNSTGGSNVYVYPYIPTTAWPFVMDYIALPPVLNAGSTEAQMLLPDEYCPVIMDRVLARLSRSEGDLEDGVMYDNRAREGEQDLLNAYDVNLDSPDPMLLTTDDFFDF